MTPEQGARLMNIARSYDKCHYVNGAYGAIPGDKNSGSPFRRGALKLLNDAQPGSKLAVSAAAISVKEYCVCAGSWRNYSGGRWTDPAAWDLVAYLTGLRAISNPALWSPFVGLFTPRRVYGQKATGDVYWGQPCAGIRHFDCVSFINYCLYELTGKETTFEIKQWINNPTLTGSQVFKIGPKSRTFVPQDGDIALRTFPHEHIAYISKEGQVVQAQSTDMGVTVSAKGAFNQEQWSHIARVR